MDKIVDFSKQLDLKMITRMLTIVMILFRFLQGQMNHCLNSLVFPKFMGIYSSVLYGNQSESNQMNTPISTFPLRKTCTKVNKTAKENLLAMALTDIPLKYREPIYKAKAILPQYGLNWSMNHSVP